MGMITVTDYRTDINTFFIDRAIRSLYIFLLKQ